MARSLIPYFFTDLPAEEYFELSPFTGKAADVSISEDDTHVYIEAPLPGVKPKDVEVTFDRGVLHVKGSRVEKEEDKSKKFYRKALSTYSYRVAVPGELDPEAQPEAECEEGVMRVSFRKKKQEQPKRIEVKQKS